MPAFFSIVCPVYNEQENIPQLIHRVATALRGVRYEFILVDDGSTDQTVACIRHCCTDRSPIKLLVLSRNFGQSAAMKAGIDAAQGEYIVTMDGDLQNDPTDILPMILHLEEKSCDMVVGRRVNRQDAWLHRKVPSRIANWIIRSTTGIQVHDFGCTLKAFRASVGKNLDLYGELHRYIPVLASFQGARITEVDVTHHPRVNGVSKYGMGRTLRVVSDLLQVLFFQKYWARSMHFFGTLGIVTGLLGGGIQLYLLILRFSGEDIWGRPLLLLGSLLVISGIQFTCFGFIAEMLFRVYYRPDRPRSYRLKEDKKHLPLVSVTHSIPTASI